MGWSLANIIDPTGLIVGGGLSGSDGLFGGDDDLPSIARPKYYEDPDYRASQDALKSLGLGLLEGKVPDYYKAIGETGSDEFEKMLGLTTGDIQTSAAEALARTGRARGGALPAVTADAVAESALKARYQDYNRALAGKMDLLGLGKEITTGVRGAGQLEGSNRNAFNWKDYGAQVDERNWQYAKEQAEDAALGEMIGTIASIGLGAATGGMSFGLQGALAGAGDALTGGGTNFLGMLTKSKSPKRAAAGVSDLGSIDDLGLDSLSSSLFFG
jgi:hypothetical protein